MTDSVKVSECCEAAISLEDLESVVALVSDRCEFLDAPARSLAVEIIETLGLRVAAPSPTPRLSPDE